MTRDQDLTQRLKTEL